MTGRYITTRACPGPRPCPDCGVPECPRGYVLDEDAEETWDDACGRCEADEARHYERVADMRRDEA